MINPQYLERLQRMYDRALELTEGDEDQAIRLVSKAADELAVGGWRLGSKRVELRRALGLESGRA